MELVILHVRGGQGGLLSTVLLLLLVLASVASVASAASGAGHNSDDQVQLLSKYKEVVSPFVPENVSLEEKKERLGREVLNDNLANDAFARCHNWQKNQRDITCGPQAG